MSIPFATNLSNTLHTSIAKCLQRFVSPTSFVTDTFLTPQATFDTHSIGMRIRKTHNLPVVHDLPSSSSGEKSPAALAGVPPTAVLVGVAGERTLRLNYEEAIAR